MEEVVRNLSDRFPEDDVMVLSCARVFAGSTYDEDDEEYGEAEMKASELTIFL